MRIVINEMKKIWNVRMFLIIVLICLLFYLLFMSFHIKYFPNGHPATEEVYYSIELLQRYGPTLEEDEFYEFVMETREKLVSEIEFYIESNSVFANAGIHSYEDYVRLSEKETHTESEREAYRALFGEECDFIGFRLQALDYIEERYHNCFSETTGDEKYRNIMDWHTYDNTAIYAFYLGILSVLAVLVLVSPLIVTDRARNIHLLQYSAKHGRRILRTQFIAVFLSAFLLTTVMILVFGGIYSTNGTWVFWNSGMTSFLNTTFLIDITYGQYIIVYIATLYTLCLGTAVASFLLSRFSRNLITLMLKLIPVFAVITVLCTKVFELTFSPANLLYIVTGITGIEAYICVFVFIAGLAISRYFLRREKTVDVL